MANVTSQAIKGIVLLAAGAVALAVGIYKGGESIFFGCVIGLVCGLVGVLFIKGDGTSKTTKRRGRK